MDQKEDSRKGATSETRPDQEHQSNVLIILAAFLSLAVAVIDALVTAISFYLSSIGTLGETPRQLYIQGTTFLATILTGFVSSQAQTLLLRDFDSHLSATAHGQRSQPNLDTISKKWRTILRVSSLRETWTRWSRFGIFATYFFIGLMTTAIVTSLSPTVSTRREQYPQAIFNGLSSVVENTGHCVYIIPVETVRGLIDQDYWWDLGNGSAYYVPANLGACPTRYAQLLVGNINNLDADVFAYADVGVAVHRTAIGAPITVYSPNAGLAPEFNGALGLYGSHARTTTQCVPVVRRNPISCRPGGQVALTNTSFSATSDDGLCTHTRAGRNPLDRPTMVKDMCPHGAVGQGTMVIAASGQYAHWLAVGIGDVAGAPPTVDNASYVVSCSVDAQDAFEHRVVKLHLRASDGEGGARYTRFLSSGRGQRCAGPEMDLSRAATLAAANWQTLFQGEGNDGWFDLVFEATGGHAGGNHKVYGYAESRNALEDVLGLVAAMVVARFNGSESYNVQTTVEIEATRVGSDNPLLLFWMLPPLFAAGMIAVMLWTSNNAKFRSVELEHLKALLSGDGHYI
ncbi:hypothetical protein B0T25DRAFT_629795 [Lasiosphaeria hispida]|uniref:Uncharacterized protein n=1 Tax=Lasiosphaeria hispida TaxID=260671 RepID=A0AAJ0HK46_9PEZI|nr:hypothetical protein B0T25DRAFT_629795 [Lasiosphaeria hispida]